MRFLVLGPYCDATWVDASSAQRAAELHTEWLVCDALVRNGECLQLIVTDPDEKQTTWYATCAIHPQITVIGATDHTESTT